MEKLVALLLLVAHGCTMSEVLTGKAFTFPSVSPTRYATLMPDREGPFLARAPNKYGPAGGSITRNLRTEENTRHMLMWRTANSCLFTGKRNAALKGFETYIQEAGLRGKVTAILLKRKWENFVAKYKDLKSPRTGVSTEGGEATAASWKWYGILDEAMGARHVIAPPVLISSSSPCPPPAVSSPPPVLTPPTVAGGSQERPGRGEKRKRELEEMWSRLQREKEEEEKKERERERLERLREEEKEAQNREEWRAQRERVERERLEWRREMVEERARWEREKAGMLDRWQAERQAERAQVEEDKIFERQQSKERENRLMALLEMAMKK